MAAPLLTGWRRRRQRLVGVLFIGVIASLVGLTVAIYQKAFTQVVMVTVEADRIGNQLSRGADVKVRGLLVGEVREVSSDGSRATLRLAVDRDAARRVPSDVKAQMVPKTLFGEKIVDLVVDDASTARSLRDGDIIRQDDSSTARETSQALDDLLPLLQALKPAQVSTTLNGLSSALRGRGDRLGANLERVDDYLTGINPDVPALRESFRGLADLSDSLNRTTPDLKRVLDNGAFLGRNLVDTSDQLGAFLASTTASTRDLDRLLRSNERRLIRLAADSRPSLAVYARYSPEFPCLAAGLVAQERLAQDTFGGLQPGLHITLETVMDQGGYQPGDEPFYGENRGPTCFGLPPNAPVRPFPATYEPVDGYCDRQEAASPGVDSTCPGRQSQGAALFEPARALVPVSAERRTVGAVIGPILGVRAGEVPDLAILLFGPVARGTVVGLTR